MSIIDTYLDSITLVRRAQHVDRFMQAVHEVAPEVYNMLMTGVYLEVQRLEATGLWLWPVQALTDTDEAAGFLGALREWQNLYHLRTDPIASYVWHMTQQWCLNLDTLGSPVSYVDAVYQDELVQHMKFPPEIKRVEDLIAAFVKKTEPEFRGDVKQHAERLKNQASALETVTEIAEALDITAADMERLAGFDWEKHPARKDQPSQYRWLVAYQCQGKRLKEIADEFDIGGRADDELLRNIARTAKQVGLTLRRAAN